ncbi:hypothetical protein ACJX0J_028873, partial [Zea mays]
MQEYTLSLCSFLFWYIDVLQCIRFVYTVYTLSEKEDQNQIVLYTSKLKKITVQTAWDQVFSCGFMAVILIHTA